MTQPANPPYDLLIKLQLKPQQLAFLERHWIIRNSCVRVYAERLA